MEATASEKLLGAQLRYKGRIIEDEAGLESKRRTRHPYGWLEKKGKTESKRLSEYHKDSTKKDDTSWERRTCGDRNISRPQYNI